MPSRNVHVFCVDVGSPKNIGWADSTGGSGGPADFEAALEDVAARLHHGELVALGFEAPIWTPRRSDLSRITSSRGGAELELRRAWSAGAGCGALGAGLALMPWCFALLAKNGTVPATTSVNKFQEWSAGLFVWEALVTGKAKGASHHHDASYGVAAFVARLSDLRSDVPAEPALNHAAVALLVAGFPVPLSELSQAGLVVAAAPRLPDAAGAINGRPAPISIEPT